MNVIKFKHFRLIKIFHFAHRWFLLHFQNVSTQDPKYVPKLNLKSSAMRRHITSFQDVVTPLPRKRFVLNTLLGLARRLSISKASVVMISRKAVLMIPRILFASSDHALRHDLALIPAPMHVEKHVMQETALYARWNMSIHSRKVSIDQR